MLSYAPVAIIALSPDLMAGSIGMRYTPFMTSRKRGAKRQPPVRRKAAASRWQRMRKWIIATLLSALAATVAAVVTDVVTSAGHHAVHAINQLTGLGNSSTGTIKTATGPTIGLEVGQGMGCQGEGWVFPLPPKQIANLPPGTGPRRHGKTWDQAPAYFGAAPADPVTLLIFASDKLNHAIVLTGLKFHVVSRAPAIRGTRLNVLQGCGGAGTFRYGYADLDLPPPYWVPNAKIPADVRADALKFPYTITVNDPEMLLITVTTTQCDCRWYAELDWVDGAVVGHAKITDNGLPFNTTAHTKMPAFIWGPAGDSGNKYQRTPDKY